MEIVTREYRRVVVMRVTGRVDAATAPEFDAALKAHSESRRSLVVELDGTQYLSSAGVRALITVQKALKSGGARVVLAQPSARVREVLDIAGLQPLFDVYDTTEAAVGSM